MLVRKDLAHPHQVVQACHASLEAARSFLSPHQEHPYVIVCGLPDEFALVRSHERLSQSGIRCSAFHEPDLDGQLTAIATEPVFRKQRRLFRNYRLLGPPS